MISVAFLAAVAPMLTWSSLSEEVGMESTLAGDARSLFSDARAAAETWIIIRPECSPPLSVRKGGSWLNTGLSSFSILLSAMPPSSLTAIPRKSRANATGSP
jgi:hypothetical protein